MAQAFFERTSKRWRGESAGIEPDEKVHPLTIETMREAGIDVSRRKPKKLTNKMLNESARVVVMDSRVLRHIPALYLSKTEDWRIEPLLGKNKEQVELIRDKIKRRTEQLSEELKAV